MYHFFCFLLLFLKGTGDDFEKFFIYSFLPSFEGIGSSWAGGRAK